MKGDNMLCAAAVDIDAEKAVHRGHAGHSYKYDAKPFRERFAMLANARFTCWYHSSYLGCLHKCNAKLCPTGLRAIHGILTIQKQL